MHFTLTALLSLAGFLQLVLGGPMPNAQLIAASDKTVPCCTVYDPFGKSYPPGCVPKSSGIACIRHPSDAPLVNKRGPMPDARIHHAIHNGAPGSDPPCCTYIDPNSGLSSPPGCVSALSGINCHTNRPPPAQLVERKTPACCSRDDPEVGLYPPGCVHPAPGVECNAAADAEEIKRAIGDPPPKCCDGVGANGVPYPAGCVPVGTVPCSPS